MKEKEARSLFDDSSVRAFLGANRAKGGLGSVGEVLNSFLEAEWRRGEQENQSVSKGAKKGAGGCADSAAAFFANTYVLNMMGQEKEEESKRMKEEI